MEFEQIFNLFEGSLWIAISAILLIRLRRKKKQVDLTIIGAAAFLAFGISDFIEVSTGAWYRPLSLFVLKAACVIALFLCLLVYRKRNRRSQKAKDIKAAKSPDAKNNP